MSLTIIKYHKTPDGIVPITPTVECRSKEQMQTQQIVKVHTRMKKTHKYMQTQMVWCGLVNSAFKQLITKSVWQHLEHIK